MTERDDTEFSPARVPAEAAVVPETEEVADVDASEDEDLGEDVEDSEV